MKGVNHGHVLSNRSVIDGSVNSFTCVLRVYSPIKEVQDLQFPLCRIRICYHNRVRIYVQSYRYGDLVHHELDYVRLRHLATKIGRNRSLNSIFQLFVLKALAQLAGAFFLYFRGA